ncbi:SH3 domain-containing protein [Paenibacillus sp. 1P07SE]|uniref:C40 family peptidase n=1 Tax=Paenibacillus sp. 1P07SE TaxID=3132209 RepID=UPI0039A451AD
MKKSLLIVIVLTLLMPLLPVTERAEAAATIQVKKSVSFRDQPNTSSHVKRYLKAGERLTVLGQPNSYWYRVRDAGGTTGYVSSSSQYITASSGGSGSTGSGTGSGTGTIVSSVSFRTGPSTGASRIRYIGKGETVTILSQPNSYWYHVRDSSGRTGYVSSQAKYIRVGGSAAQPPASGGTSQNGSAERAITAGMRFLGTPYQYGSNRSSTATFDCSDFVRRAFLNGLGITLPADSRGQGAYVKNKGNAKSNWRNLKRGDLMFFMSYKGTSASSYSGINKSTATITHVGIYLGNGQILHTYSKESGGVRTDSIAGRHWEHRFLFGGSAL